MGVTGPPSRVAIDEGPTRRESGGGHREMIDFQYRRGRGDDQACTATADVALDGRARRGEREHALLTFCEVQIFHSMFARGLLFRFCFLALIKIYVISLAQLPGILSHMT